MLQSIEQDKRLKEECGVFGIFGHENAARITYLGLYALQHRGQESAGIVVSDGKQLTGSRGMGLVYEVFKEEKLQQLTGKTAIGHIRYSTTGSSVLKNAQPFQVDYSRGSLAVAHNGNLVNTSELRSRLEKAGSIFQSTMDSEIIVHLVAKSQGANFEDALIESLLQLKGAYSLLLLTQDQMIGARDPHGFRPLCLGKLDGSYVLSSETCALDLIQAEYIRDVAPGEILDLIQAEYIRDVAPGEIVIIDKEGLHSLKPFPPTKTSLCIFEFIYFSRPDSHVFGESVYQARKRLGRELALEQPAECDLVIPMPDSGNCAALGFAEASKIPLEMGIIRNHYVGRTFIQPSQTSRDLGVKVKLNPVREVIKDKRIVVIEDSIVRGTTSKIRMKNLREAGAKEVHMRVSCPPHRYPCYYGIDFPTREELIASSNSVEEIGKFIGLDSLGYLSLDRMIKAMPFAKE
ncbi:MAG: class II glutamine amidotransferase, partial [Deltaproteobacteria bacterium]|nr:class II glutamine amidotransferase [Deltaproteobacteria bacterium]